MSLVAKPKFFVRFRKAEFHPVGSDKEIKVDVRVVAATNKIYKKEIEDENLEDLYHRLSVIEIYVPPLDARKEDIPFW